jgi:hypothetical protein
VQSKAEQKLIMARNDADAARERAKGEADAIREIA